MKLIALGDTHGRNTWQKILDKETADKIVFIGDYFDSFNLSAQDQKENFNAIIAYKEANMDKVILLLGNHDFHYLKSADEVYSGHQQIHSFDIGELLHNAIDKGLIQLCYVHDKYLFTHAGVSKTWLASALSADDTISNNLEEQLNNLFKYKPTVLRFMPGKNRSDYGDDITQSPIWIREKSLLQDQLDDYTQIVGHTIHKKIELSDKVTIIDALDSNYSNEEYLEIKDGVMSVKKLDDLYPM